MARRLRRSLYHMIGSLPAPGTFAAVTVLLGILLVLIGFGTLREPMGECDYLIILKREVLRCDDDIARREGVETRLECGDRRAEKVAAALGHQVPERREALVALYAGLEAAVHERRLSPRSAALQLQGYIGDESCLGGLRGGL